MTWLGGIAIAYGVLFVLENGWFAINYLRSPEHQGGSEPAGFHFDPAILDKIGEPLS